MVQIAIFGLIAFGVFRFGMGRRNKPRLISDVWIFAAAVAAGMLIGAVDFVIYLFTEVETSVEDYITFDFHGFTLGCLVIALVLTAIYQSIAKRAAPIVAVVAFSVIAFVLVNAGVFYLLNADFFDFDFYVEQVFDNLARIDVASSYYLQAAAVYTVAATAFVYILSSASGDVQRVRSSFNPGEAIVSFKSSANEPARLLLGLASVGRLPMVAQLRRDRDHPCQATPIALDVSTETVLKAADQRDAEEVKRHVWYVVLSLITIVLVAAELPAVALLPILAAGIIFFRRLQDDRYKVAAAFQPETFNADDSAQQELQSRNLVTYKGYSPFQNFGFSFGSWMLVVDTKRAKKSDGVSDASLVEPDIPRIEAAISTAMAKSGMLEADPKPMYFMQGANIPESIKAKGASAPPAQLSEDRYAPFVHDQSSPIRRYLWLRKIAWHREISVSYFVRLVRQGDDLHLEITGVLMPPVGKEYRWVDEITPQTFMNVVLTFLGSLVGGAAMLVWSPLRAFIKANEAFGKLFTNPAKAIRKTVEQTPNFDFGAPVSLRRQVADSSVMTYFQEMDRSVAEAAFAGRVTRTFIDCLDACGIDTSELRDQQTTLLNQGIVVQGGDLKAENVAAGVGARINKAFGGRKSGEAKGSKS